MNIIIDDISLNELKEDLSKKENKDSIKIFVAAMRCSGPSLSLALYEKKPGDKVVSVDGVDFYLDEGVEEYGESLDISKREGFGGGYNIKISDINPTSCPI